LCEEGRDLTSCLDKEETHKEEEIERKLEEERIQHEKDDTRARIERAKKMAAEEKRLAEEAEAKRQAEVRGNALVWLGFGLICRRKRHLKLKDLKRSVRSRELG